MLTLLQLCQREPETCWRWWGTKHKSALHTTYTVPRLFLVTQKQSPLWNSNCKGQTQDASSRRRNQMAFRLWARAEPKEGGSDFPPGALPADGAAQLIFRLRHKAGPACRRSGWHFICPTVPENLQSHNTNHCKTGENPLTQNLNLVFKKIIYSFWKLQHWRFINCKHLLAHRCPHKENRASLK